MKRRNFLIATAGTAVLSGIGCHSNLSDQENFSSGLLDKIKKIAGFSLSELYEKLSSHFYDDFLPFFLKNMVNYKDGGFYPYTEWDGKPISGVEGQESWWLGRGIWMVSFLYNNLKKEQGFLDIGERAVNIIIRNKPDGDFLWHKSFTPDGKPAENPSDYIYDDLFIAEGLAEFGIASGDKQYIEMAKQTILKCLRIYDSPEYKYTPTYGLNIEPLKTPGILGHWMVFLVVTTQMLRYNDDPEIKIINDRAVDAIMNYFFNPEFKLLNEILNHDLSRPGNDFSQFVYIGHAMETLWMVMWEAVRREDKELFNSAVLHFRHHVEVAWDDVYGGVFRSLNHVGKNIWELDKQMWVQVEIMVGMLLALEYGGFDWAGEWYGKMYNYFVKNFSLKKFNSPMWLLGGSRRPWDEPRQGTGAIYHLPRWMMMNLLSVERMMGKRN
ncbi:MAG: AGE family epimerase/isomerase [Bacteroidales bacterium]|nr:AGE family epimerase/isomerase [Bacteroidales bacterium]